jgi:hypothetical protein
VKRQHVGTWLNKSYQEELWNSHSATDYMLLTNV